jgi:FkbM family methyltransferase
MSASFWHSDSIIDKEENMISHFLYRVIRKLIPLLSLHDRVALSKDTQTSTKFDINDCDVKIVCNSIYELEKRSGLVESETLAWLKTWVSDGDVFLDVGASVGTYGLIAAKLYPNLTVYSVEPSFTNFNSLCQNILLNSFEQRMFPFCGAFSIQRSLSTFLMPNITAGAAGHQIANKQKPFEKPVRFSSLVPVYSVDDFASELGITVNHIKVDVDGLDFEVIKGAEKTLHNNALKSICIEVDENTINAITKYLGKYGFKPIDNPNRIGTTWNITLIR